MKKLVNFFKFIALIAIIELVLFACDDGKTPNIDPCANGHNFGSDSDWVEDADPATCEAPSYDTRSCKNTPCIAKDKRTGSHPALGHNLPGAYAATCMAAGNTGTGHCDRCGEDFTGEVIPIDSDNHDFSEWTQKTAATCVSPERQIRECTHNAAHTEEENIGEINPAAHDWSEWAVIQPTETTDGGDEERKCSHNLNHIEYHATGNILYATGTAGLEYELVTGFSGIQDSNSYVVRAGTVTSGEVYIPAFHRLNADSEYLPVTHTGTGDGGYEGTLFRGNQDITAIHFLAPSNISYFGACDFQGTSITEITLPEGLTNIGRYTFQYTNLTKITIPEGITYIPEATFRGCVNLEEINLPEGLRDIGTQAFQYCTSLTEITLPESLQSIGFVRAFEGCTSLTSVTFMGGTVYLYARDNFPGDLDDKYSAEDGGIGTYTREAGSEIWTKLN
ncbi:MAG: leucine-rich repeat domain-containing protein [Treponema sp.]|nr:leucine-rich repeat domain-containing protein [Treponema sp.]